MPTHLWTEFPVAVRALSDLLFQLHALPPQGVAPRQDGASLGKENFPLFRGHLKQGMEFTPGFKVWLSRRYLLAYFDVPLECLEEESPAASWTGQQRGVIFGAGRRLQYLVQAVVVGARGGQRQVVHWAAERL